MKRLLKFLAALLLGLMLLETASGQTAVDSFNPNANGVVNVIVIQPDGKILLGGAFTTLAPNGGPTVTRNRIARLNADGTLDTGFNPNAIAEVYAIAVQADGKILVGGIFSGANSIGGQTRNHIARLDPITGLADSFDPNASATVVAIVVQADGKILAGGAFSGANSIGGQMRNYVARLDPTTGLADSFDPNASRSNINNHVRTIAVQPDGKVLVGGRFSAIGGQTRNNIAGLDPVTGLADSFNPNSNQSVSSLAVQADGKIWAGGLFTFIGGQSRGLLARLDPDTGLADSFNPYTVASVISPSVNSVVVQPDGKILVGGRFGGMGGQPRNHLARLDPNTGWLADSFDPNVGGVESPYILSIAVQSDGKVLAGGSFTTITPGGGASVVRNRIARLTDSGAPCTLGNISTRLRVLAGDNALIGGMIATGTVGKTVIIRAIGPTLNDFGVPGALQDPTIELYQGERLIISNDNWRQSFQQAKIQNTGLAPNKDAESAIMVTLTPNQNYTAIVRGKDGSTGVGVVEAFDLDQAEASKLGNISTRGFVDVDDNVMIAGLIVSPINGTNTKVLVRALGPTLGDFGVSGFLANPTLDLVNSSGTVIRSNDNWRSDQQSEIEAANLAPNHDEEAALVQTVPPGAYTAVVRGSGRTTGVALVEAYDIQ